MLWVKWPVLDRIHLQSNKFATGVENKATKLNSSPWSKMRFQITCLTSLLEYKHFRIITGKYTSIINYLHISLNMLLPLLPDPTFNV